MLKALDRQPTLIFTLNSALQSLVMLCTYFLSHYLKATNGSIALEDCTSHEMVGAFLRKSKTFLKKHHAYYVVQ